MNNGEVEVGIQDRPEVVMQILNKAEKVKATQPEGQKLVDKVRAFKTEAKIKVKFSETPVGIPEGEVGRLLQGLSNEQKKQGWQSTVLRIDEQTDYFAGIRQRDLVVDTLMEERKPKWGFTFYDPNTVIGKHVFGKLVVGEGNAGAKRGWNDIYIEDWDKNYEEAWNIMATAGKAPQVAHVIDHEDTHARQKDAGDAKLGLLVLASGGVLISQVGADNFKSFDVPKIVTAAAATFEAAKIGVKYIRSRTPYQEVHAYNKEYSNPFGLGERNFKNMDWLNQTYKLGLNEEDTMALAAIETQITDLRLLGASEEEIGKLTHGGFDSVRSRYADFENAVNERCKKLGIESVGEQDDLLEALEQIYQIEKVNQNKLAKIIAIQELKREAGRVDWRYKDEEFRLLARRKQSSS